MAHTKLPWEVVKSQDGDGMQIAAIQSTTGEWVCDGDSWIGKESRANAEFIVRACNSHQELVEALEAAERELRDAASYFATAYTRDKITSIVDRANAVLAKARGRTD